MSDCAALLAAQDTLAGSATLNWSADLAIGDWAGVTVGGSPGRVTGLDLSNNQLGGTIPAELGDLPYLQVLDLSGNQLIRYDTGGTGQPDQSARTAALWQLPVDRLAYRMDWKTWQAMTWRDSVCGSCSDPTGDCATDGAVTDAANNPGLVSDCTALLAARDTLAENAPLNWSAGLAIQRWDGVRVGGSPLRATHLNLQARHLTGTIPEELGSLINLKLLTLSRNQLTGTIPEELGSLTNLEFLTLSRNQLTGTIPEELGNLINLKSLEIWDNQLTGYDSGGVGQPDQPEIPGNR